MPMSRSDRRAALADARIHLSRAIASLPEGDRDIRHWPALLAVMVRSIDEEIGTKTEDYESPPCDRDSIPVAVDGWHATGGGPHPKDGDVDERELAHNFQMPAHGRGER